MQRQRSLDAAIVSALLAVGFPASTAMAQTSTTLSGPPVQVQPYAPEPGVPLITVSPRTPNPFPGGTGPSGPGGAGAGKIVTLKPSENTKTRHLLVYLTELPAKSATRFQ